MGMIKWKIGLGGNCSENVENVIQFSHKFVFYYNIHAQKEIFVVLFILIYFISLPRSLAHRTWNFNTTRTTAQIHLLKMEI